MKPPSRSRLKLYISPSKYRLWEGILVKTNPNSPFFTNFNQWVRNSLKSLPDPGETPLYPQKKSKLQGLDESEGKKIEKTIWIQESIKTGLQLKRGHLSLNAYVILILDLEVFGSSTYQSMVYHVFQLQERVEALESRLHKIHEDMIIKFQK